MPFDKKLFVLFILLTQTYNNTSVLSTSLTKSCKRKPNNQNPKYALVFLPIPPHMLCSFIDNFLKNSHNKSKEIFYDKKIFSNN